MVSESVRNLKEKVPTRPVSALARITKPNTTEGTKYLFKLFRITGILMTNQSTTLYIIYSLVYKFIIIILVPLSFIMSYIMTSEKFHLNTFLTSLQVCMSTCTCTIKMCILVCTRSHVIKFRKLLGKLDARIQYPEEISEGHKAILFGNRAVLIYLIGYYGYSTIALLASMVMGRPPYALYIPYLDWQKSSTNFVVASALEYIFLNIAISQQITNDSCALVHIGILHSHLKILITRVLRIGTDAKWTQDDNQRELVMCIRDHKIIIELVNAMKPFISATYFVQFITTVANLGASLINISTSDDTSTLFGSAVFAICLVLQILPICYLVNSLTAECDRLPEAIFHMNWVDQSPQFRRLCLFFMHRSQSTIVFYAGKMLPVSLETFLSIIKFSFSLYTLLSSIGLAQKFM